MLLVSLVRTFFEIIITRVEWKVLDLTKKTVIFLNFQLYTLSPSVPKFLYTFSIVCRLSPLPNPTVFFGQLMMNEMIQHRDDCSFKKCGRLLLIHCFSIYSTVLPPCIFQKKKQLLLSQPMELLCLLQSKHIWHF